MFFTKYLAFATIAITAVVVVPSRVQALPLSPGDRLRVSIPDEGFLETEDRFSGTYEVNLDGNLAIPYLPPLPVQGLEIAQVQQRLRQALIAGGFFRPQFLQLGVTISQWAPVQVTVSGAVFQPGRVLINDPALRAQNQNQPGLPPVSGDYPPERYLTAAIRTAGGVKPNADIQNVRLVRGEQERVFDLSGVFTGGPVEDVPLVAGDLVVVPQFEVAQNNELVRPSQVTPLTIPVFFSNLSSPNPGGGNAQAQELAYGSRFSNAVIAAKCVGGSQPTNAKRRVVLVQTDRLTGQVETLNRSVEDLVRNPSDEVANPYLMPGDGVVCYDSTVTNVSSVFRVIGDILNPLNVIRDLIFGDNE
ncbi:MAG: polysaccharide export protein [Kastovskya adunca ATA6-11-RM4]|jgi:polysaccharide export outer membrane protein|nr:polysaccharide export protein [Kastovskya adunca ATA6-11-RM4]